MEPAEMQDHTSVIKMAEGMKKNRTMSKQVQNPIEKSKKKI